VKKNRRAPRAVSSSADTEWRGRVSVAGRFIVGDYSTMLIEPELVLGVDLYIARLESSNEFLRQQARDRRREGI
jgi:hypothetical protein